MDNAGLRSAYTTNKVFQAICDNLAARQRSQSETKLDTILSHLTRDGLRVKRSEVIAAFRLFEEIGCGRYKEGRHGHRSRFVWDVRSLDVSKAATEYKTLDAESALETPDSWVVPAHEENGVNSDANEQPESDNEDVIEGADEGDLEHSGVTQSVVIEKNDRSLSELERWHRDGRLTLDPEWQRNYVWSDKAASRLIESFLIDLPVPVIYLSRSEEGTYEVIDGLQRLTSVFKFFDGRLVLKDLEIRRELKGKTFRTLDRPLQNKIRDATVRTFELAPSTSKDLLFVIFERLNSGGTALNDMEIRNCLFRGSLNRLIKDLANSKDLKICVNQKNIEKRMTDRLLVLRFLAFYERTYLKATKGLKRFLNDFLQDYREPKQFKLEEFEQQFKKAMRSAVTVFGEYGFRLRKSDTKKAAEWTPRVNAAIFQVLAVSFTSYDAPSIARRADGILEDYLDLITRDNKWVDAVSKSTGDPERIHYAFEAWNKRLGAVMEGSEGNDSVRCFSRALKKEMFAQNPACAICHQQIRLVNDAALDHEEHYWRGGRTVPENARLVHRVCNAARPL